MIFNRLKDIIRASINDSFEFLKNADLDFDSEAWKKYDSAYEQMREEQQKYEQTYRRHSAEGVKSDKALSYYQVLEVPPDASFEQIKKSYRKLMKMYHPDLFRNQPEKHEVALEISRQLNEAYTYFEQKFGK